MKGRAIERLFATEHGELIHDKTCLLFERTVIDRINDVINLINFCGGRGLFPNCKVLAMDRESSAIVHVIAQIPG